MSASTSVAGFGEFDLPFEGTSIHYWRGGKGQPLLLLHGSGPGASTLSNFSAILAPLAERFDVVAADLVGFGLSGRKASQPYFDMAMWGRQADALIALFAGAGKVGLLGHSLSGALVLKAAARNPRVGAVMTTGTMGVATQRRAGSRGWAYPDGKDQIREHAARTVVDPSLISDEEISRRQAVLQAPGYREYFESMFGEAADVYAERSAVSDAELAAIRCPVVLTHGADDRSFTPESTSIALARKLRQADVAIFANTAHSVALEQPHKLLDIAVPFFQRNLG